MPSFVVNVMTQWANILIYFQMPEWVNGWDNIFEDDDDPDEVKALKVSHSMMLRWILFRLHPHLLLICRNFSMVMTSIEMKD
jgi:hypothetical protein